jgi:hypothetical protein
MQFFSGRIAPFSIGTLKSQTTKTLALDNGFGGLRLELSIKSASSSV